ncbi:MFS transporter [Ferrovibrio sp.]|uniref:MFS transporter n=1 Tax=Ferrovibrio sp. TaxID=1917215 RepID=UPI001B5B825E|nr:MFS transporter [Ferrovibrio sp.]MBP7062548.1 MFS transporter [Ferrovibrio sp.]
MTQPFHHASLSRAQSIWILGGAALMLSLAMGMRQSQGLFMRPIGEDLGVSASDYAFALAIQNIVWGVTQPFTGALVDRYGTRWAALIGCLLYAAGFTLTAFATGPVQIMLGAGVLIGVALSCTTSGIAAKIAARVVRPERRSLAFGLVSAAGSIGTFFCAPLAQGAIAAYGWQIATFVFIGLTAAMLPAAFLGSRADKVPLPSQGAVSETLGQTLGEARRHGGYIVMAAAFFVCGLQLVFITTHLPTYLADCGIDPMVGAQALAVIGAFNVFGSWLFGWLGDRYPKRTLLGLIYLLRSFILAAYFMFPASQATTLLFAAAMGTLWLGVIPLVNGLVAQIFGIRFLATLTGIAFFSHQVGSFLGAWAGGVIYDSLGSYSLAWQLAAGIGVAAGLMQLFMNDRPTPRMAALQTQAAE